MQVGSNLEETMVGGPKGFRYTYLQGAGISWDDFTAQCHQPRAEQINSLMNRKFVNSDQ